MKNAKLATKNISGIRRSRQDWFNHVDAWKVSGLTQKAYCLQHSLCLRQFVQWRCRFKKDQENIDSRSSQTSDFIPVQVISEKASTVPHPQSITVTLPNQICLSFTQGSDISTTVSVIRQLMNLSC